MKTTILRAKHVLSDMFGINIKQFKVNSSRKRNVVEARRFLIYFLCKELEINYSDIPRFIPAITNHATALHHTKLLQKYLDVEKPTQRKYEAFKELLLGDECTTVEREIGVLLLQKKTIQNQINNLKTLLK